MTFREIAIYIAGPSALAVAVFIAIKNLLSFAGGIF